MRMLHIKGVWPERLGWMLLAASLAWGVIQWWAWASLDKRHPIDLSQPVIVTTPTPEITEGDRLLVVIHRTKVRDDCPVVSIRKALSATGPVYGLNSRLWAGGKSSKAAVDIEYDTRFLPPGHYILSVDLHYSCPGDLTFDLHQPDLEFAVMPEGYIPIEQEQRMMIDQLSREVQTLKEKVE